MAQNSSLSGLGRNDDGRLRTFVILVVVSIVLLTLACRPETKPVFDAAQGAASVVTAPVRAVGNVVTMPFRGLGNVIGNLTAPEETLSELRDQNEQLIAENALLREQALAAERLEALLELQSTNKLTSTGARVISGAVDSATSTITIDKGSTSGLEVGMPVTDSLGLVGQISECNPTTSVVRLITDERSGVAALVQESRAQGQAEGASDGSLRLTLVPSDQKVELGDIVVTSGLGGVFPKGLPLGIVTSVNRGDGELYQTIIMRPVALTTPFEEVLVVTDITDDQHATAEEADAAQRQDANAQANAAQSPEDGDDGGADGGADGQ